MLPALHSQQQDDIERLSWLRPEGSTEAPRPRGPEAGGVDRAAERPRLASALLLPTGRLLRTGIKKDLLVEVRNFLVH